MRHIVKQIVPVNSLNVIRRVSRQYVVLFCIAAFSLPAPAVTPLNIITSDNPGSNALHSFIYVPQNRTIPEGIKRDAKSGVLKLQIPFVIDLPVSLTSQQHVRWRVSSNQKNNGGISVLSKYAMNEQKQADARLWLSDNLTENTEDRTRLVFRPDPPQHEPAIYKKGRGENGQRRRYGGGTTEINFEQFNPQVSYDVEAIVTDTTSGQTEKYSGKISMDYKDMIRQEYINHYGINRYGRGENGNIPVPTRDEINDIPAMPSHLLGNSLSESNYGLMINDGIVGIAGLIVDLYERFKLEYKQNAKPLLDKNGRRLNLPESELWLSGGWRNPERNEWYSNALNGIHQRGGAIDIVANEPHNDERSAIVYWFLWQALESQNYIDAFWQLETNGRPMTTQEFKEDIEPANGIPDAFDKADHVHINIKYE